MIRLAVFTFTNWLIEHGFTSVPTQYRLYGRRVTEVSIVTGWEKYDGPSSLPHCCQPGHYRFCETPTFYWLLSQRSASLSERRRYIVATVFKGKLTVKNFKCLSIWDRHLKFSTGNLPLKSIVAPFDSWHSCFCWQKWAVCNNNALAHSG